MKGGTARKGKADRPEREGGGAVALTPILRYQQAIRARLLGIALREKVFFGPNSCVFPQLRFAHGPEDAKDTTVAAPSFHGTVQDSAFEFVA